MELIDFEKKGNATRLYFGKNGEQTGDDWDDAPYQHNAGTVYPEYIERTVDMYFSVEVDTMEPADLWEGPSYCKNDFIYKKSWVIWVEKEYNNVFNLKPVSIFFGDTLEEIKEKTKEYKPLFVEVEGV